MFDHDNDNAQKRGLAYDVSLWQGALFGARNAKGSEMSKALAPIATALRTECGKASGTVADSLGEEVFARFYDSPEKKEQAVVPWAGGLHAALDGDTEFTTLASVLDGDPDLSALAVMQMAPFIAKTLPDVLEAAKKAQEEAEAEAERRNEEERKRAEEAGEEPQLLDPTALGQAAAQAAAAQAARPQMLKAVQAAAEGTEQAREILAGIMPGLEAAPPSHAQRNPRRLELARKLMGHKRAVEMIRKAGRIARLADARKRVRTEDVPEEVVDIEMGADLNRLLSTELMGFVIPELKAIAIAKLADRGFLQYRLEGHDMLGRGPIIGLIDVSGSMSGAPLDTAISMGIAMLGIGHREKRQVTIAAFDTRIRNVVKSSPSGRVEKGTGVNSHNWQIAKDGIELVEDMLTWAVAGGTSFDEPIRFALDHGARDERADILLVTDGQAYVSGDVIAELARIKATKGTRIFALTLNGGHTAGAIAEVADAVVDLDAARDIEAAIAAVASVVP